MHVSAVSLSIFPLVQHTEKDSRHCCPQDTRSAAIPGHLVVCPVVPFRKEKVMWVQALSSKKGLRKARG